ncbi:MarR family winged helix-turn-helix transcriptional regulator [Actinomadura rupiterrae]|uniref:MarR family winged helix-turn-helix transcriptional regulator n=1 Tax=Actinomadura rupiterrae TaxID=559627 RepID=UPI0020A3C10C|nr:MarR family transcriptional regulator [Actinomadura rupiterrae]MCP2336428.1 DNA-binding MarR family transcriptional regulator [Actinomadura rupiterrae]
MGDAMDAILEQWARERPDLDLWAMGANGRIARLRHRLQQANHEFYRQHGLENHEFDMLATLRRSGEPYALTPGALLKASLVTSGAITNRIDKLEAKGLVERVRDGSDRRSVRIRLTPRGLDLIDGLMGPHVDNVARMLSALSPEQREQFDTALRVLLESLDDTTIR